MFYLLNAARALSIIALLLVFASSIVVMVDDVKAVNEFMSEQQTGHVPDASIFYSDYIECVLFVLYTVGHLSITSFIDTQRYLTNLLASSGLLLIGS